MAQCNPIGRVSKDLCILCRYGDDPVLLEGCLRVAVPLVGAVDFVMVMACVGV
jgi:hypothetical protein